MKYRVLKKCYFGAKGENPQLRYENEIYQGDLAPEDAPAYLLPLDEKAQEIQAEALEAKANDRANRKAQKNAAEAEVAKSKVLKGNAPSPASDGVSQADLDAKDAKIAELEAKIAAQEEADAKAAEEAKAQEEKEAAEKAELAAANLQAGKLTVEDVPFVQYQSLKSEASKRGFKGNGKAEELVKFVQDDIVAKSAGAPQGAATEQPETPVEQ